MELHNILTVWDDAMSTRNDLADYDNTTAVCINNDYWNNNIIKRRSITHKRGQMQCRV